MILMRILPGVLKELLKHVPTVLFEAVEWSELAAELPKLSRRIMKKEGYDELYRHHEQFLSPLNIKLTHAVTAPGEFKDNNLVGQRVLSLYFAQLFSPQGLFLDLRPNVFDNTETELLWQPTGIWTKFSPSFSEGLLKIYEGFYSENGPLYLEGLTQIGLSSPSWPEEDRLKLADLFKAQFGSSLESEMRFNLEVFKTSLFRIADFLLAKKVNISKDFLYLGIYLVTMYSTLEKTNAKLNVKQTYLDIRNQFKA